MHKPAVGHIYVLELADGVTKVGYTAAPAVRMGHYAGDSKQSGLEVLRHWMSPRHLEAGVNEEELIAQCTRLGGSRYGSERAREWFTGLQFENVVAAAENLCFTPPTGRQAVSIEEARAKLGDLIREAQILGTVTAITRNGKPAAYIVPDPPVSSVEVRKHVVTLAGLLGGMRNSHHDFAPGGQHRDYWRQLQNATAELSALLPENAPEIPAQTKEQDQ